jgi:hypothetical protein
MGLYAALPATFSYDEEEFVLELVWQGYAA